MGQHGAGQQPQAADVHVESVVPLFLGVRFCGAGKQLRCIVHQHVDSIESEQRGLDQSVDVPGADDVGAHRLASGPDFLRYSVQFFLVTSGDHNPGTLARECHGNAATNTAAAAGDDGNLFS